MFKKLLISAVALFILLGGVIFVWQKKMAETQNLPLPEENTQSTDKSKAFVTDVDPDVSHWQTKETKYMTFKFPKEWYWIEISVEKPGANGAHVISNNPNFPLEDYKNDSVNMTGVPGSTLTDTEVVITDWGTPTSNVGTPLDSLNYRIDSVKNLDPTNRCFSPLDTETLPIVASCLVKQDNHQVTHEYYIIDKTVTLIITARTTDNTLVPEDILEKIARNIKIKY